MKGPLLRASSLLKGWPSVILVSILPFVFMGLMGMPKQAKGGVQIEALVKQVKWLNAHKKHKESLELLSSALELENDPLIRSLLLQTFDVFLEEQIHRGEEDLRLDQKNVAAYVRVASSFELLEQKGKALQVLVEGISRNPQASDLWMEIGKLELKAGRDMEAFDVFKEVIKNNPKNARACNNAAFILARYNASTKSDLKEAKKLAEKARKLEPKNPDYMDTLAELFFREGEVPKAKKLIKEAIRLAPNKESFKSQLKRFNNASGAVAAP